MKPTFELDEPVPLKVWNVPLTIPAGTRATDLLDDVALYGGLANDSISDLANRFDGGDEVNEDWAGARREVLNTLYQIETSLKIALQMTEAAHRALSAETARISSGREP